MSAPKDDDSFQGQLQETLTAESFSTLKTLPTLGNVKAQFCMSTLIDMSSGRHVDFAITRRVSKFEIIFMSRVEVMGSRNVNFLG